MSYPRLNHLRSTDHGLTDATIVQCLTATDETAIHEFVEALHNAEHEAMDTSDHGARGGDDG